MNGSGARTAYSFRNVLPFILYQISFVVVTSLAAGLTPSESGVGTHEQLGLPPCAFMTVTGIPCPSCGLTTSFAHLVHGRMACAFAAQPFGVILYGVLCAGFGASFVAMARRKRLSEILEARWMEWLQFVLLAVLVLAWAYKIVAMGLRTH